MSLNNNKKNLLGGLILALSVPAVQAVEFSAFGAVNYDTSDAEAQPDSFILGEFDLFGSQQISENTFTAAELVVEVDGTEFEVELERLWVRRDISSAFQIAAGRFHVPLGYWNRTFHHGALLQDTIRRPFFIEFEGEEGNVLPAHGIGLMASGSFSPGPSKWGYEALVGNGSSINTEDLPSAIDVNSSDDPSSEKMFIFRLKYQTPKLPLQLGVFGMYNSYAESGVNSPITSRGRELIEQTVAGLDLYYSGDRFEVLAEYYNIRNDDSVGDAGSNTGHAAYIQLGYRISAKYKVVYRGEIIRFEEDDPYFQYLGTVEQDHQVLSLRYDLDESNALKFEYHATRRTRAFDEDENELILQWAFLML